MSFELEIKTIKGKQSVLAALVSSYRTPDLELASSYWPCDRVENEKHKVVSGSQLVARNSQLYNEASKKA